MGRVHRLEGGIELLRGKNAMICVLLHQYQCHPHNRWKRADVQEARCHTYNGIRNIYPQKQSCSPNIDITTRWSTPIKPWLTRMLLNLDV